jgi:cyanophycinase
VKIENFMKISFHLLAVWATSALFTLCEAAAAPAITNVIVGGGERRCSSFTGSAPGRDCSAPWETILREDPAFHGLSMEDVLFAPDYAAPTFSYALDAQHLAAFAALPQAFFDDDRKRLLLDQLAALLTQAGPRTGLPWETLHAELTSTSPGIDSLTLAETAVLRSALVDTPALPRRKVQGRSIVFSSNAASVDITRSFVAAARERNDGRTPLIGVVTASAGPHPFVDRDINVYSLVSAGAEVVYLPMEGGFRQALDMQDCANTAYYYTRYANTNPERLTLHSNLLFPDLAMLQRDLCADNGSALNALLQRLNGIYFSGGNQARHLESFVSKDGLGFYTVTSPQLRILQSRHAQGKLVVAGTSAGNHVQGGGLWRSKPVPMIGGGDSYDVLKKGFRSAQGPQGELAETGHTEATMTYAPALYERGGLGMFRYGVLDSHFSRRTREARLIRAVADSAMDYGFGVDENTALLVTAPDNRGTTHFTVKGAGGVFIADLRQASFAARATDKLFSVRNVIAHYLLPGDAARIDRRGRLRVHLSRSRPVLAASRDAATALQDRVLDYGSSNFLRLASAMGRSGAAGGWGSTHNSTDKRSQQDTPLYSITLSREADTTFRGERLSEDAAGFGVSYAGLRIQISPCDDRCAPPADFRNTMTP